MMTKSRKSERYREGKIVAETATIDSAVFDFGTAVGTGKRVQHWLKTKRPATMMVG